MGKQPAFSATPQKLGTNPILVLSMTIALLLLTLACGSFAPRPGELPPPTLTRSPALSLAPPPSPSPPRPLAPSPPRPLAPSPTRPLALSPTPTLTPSPSHTLALSPTSGQQARILAPSGVNIREEPSTKAGRVGFYPAGALVVVLDGPVQADEYIWWQVDDEHGKQGWVAGVNREGELWLSGDLGEPRPVNRPVRLGDTVYVSVASNRSLTVRYEPGTKGFVARRVVGGTLLSIIEGPVLLDGKRWWKVQREDGLTGWAAEGDRETRWLKPVE